MDTFGPYRLDELIGRGAVGELWRAYDTVKDRVVALKRLPPHTAASSEFQERLSRAARIAARLREPHVIPIHDFGVIEGQPFIDMRLVEGLDLASTLALSGPIAPARAVEVLDQLGLAVDAAHRAGLIHRDIKPSNVLLTAAGPGRVFVYLTDFGIAHALGDIRGNHIGTEVGTVAYFAPERDAGVGDHRGDLYALGGLLYTMLTGAEPFAGDAQTQMHAHLHPAPAAPSQLRPDLPARLDAVVATAMATNPEDRYPNAAELTRAARAVLTPC